MDLTRDDQGYLGTSYILHFPGMLKLFEGFVHCTLLLVSIVLIGLSEMNSLIWLVCSLSVCSLVTLGTFLILHMQGFVRKIRFPCLWVECINCALLTLLHGLMGYFLLAAKHIDIGLLCFLGVLVYAIDTIEGFYSARKPRIQYGWAVPNMPEAIH